MKIFLIFVSLFLWLGLHSQPDGVPGSTAYGIKSGKIVYHFNNLMQEGTTTVIFDDSGRYVKTITEAHLIVDKAGFAAMDTNMAKALRVNTRRLTIRTPDMQYVEDLDSLRGYRQARGLVVTPESLFGDKLKVTGKDTVLGRPCVITEIVGGIRVWSWLGIALKTETIAEGDGPKAEVTAISIDEHYRIRPNEFVIPKNARVETH